MKHNWYKPIAFWSWNAALDSARLEEQVKEFADAGFGGFFIHARAGLKTAYLGREWFDCCRAVCIKAKQLGLDVYLYDEDGWPSGFAGGKVPRKSDAFCQRAVSFTDSSIPDNCTIISAYRRLQNGDYELIWKNDGCQPAPKADLYAYCVVNKSYTDLTSKSAVSYFIETTHEVYYHELKDFFGDVIKGIFTDEPQLVTNGFHWGEEVEQEYDKRFGRSLINDLWMLAYNAQSSEETAKVRYNYRLLLQQLFKENFTNQIYEWCDAHGIEFTGHFAAEDGLVMQLEANAGVMYQYEGFHIPGIDHLGRRFAPLPLLKQVQSVAAQTGRERRLSETFGCSGWNLSFEAMTQIWGWQAINGLNTPCLHLSAYSLEGSRKRDYPPVFSYQTPWWEQMVHMSRWMTNVNRFFSECERKADLLVIQPMHYLWEIYSPISSTECRRLSSEFRILTENLRGLQLDFDLGDETLLSEIGAVAEGKLRVGRQSYSMVMVSETDRLEESTIKLLELFIQQGGKVVFIGKIPGNAGHLQATVQMNNKTILRKFFLHIHWKFSVQLCTENNRSLVDNVHNFLGVTKDGTRRIGFYLATEGILKQKVRMFIDGRCKVWRVDSLTDKRVLVPAVYHDDFTEVLFELNGRSLALFEAKEMESRAKDKDAENLATNLLKTEIIPLEAFDIRLLAPNSFTLDMAELYCDGILIGNRQPLSKIRNLLKKLAETTDDKNHVIDIRFVFKSSLPSGTPLSLGLELDSMRQVFCNGFDITSEAGGNNWFVDRSIKCIPIKRFVRNGDNEIICRYILNSGDRLHFDGEFETERNRFCPTLEPENIYLIGNFNLKANGKVSHRTVYISVSGDDDFDTSPEFVLCPMEQLKFAPFTEQGLWFYRGNILLETKLPSFPEWVKVELHIKHVYAALCSVQVNDSEPIPLFSSLVELDITPFMTERENRLKITLFGTNRNLLGPHHHCKGEIDFIGNESFDGILNWTDFFSPDLTEPSTWTDRYSFIPFGMDGCEIVITKPAD